MKKLLFFVFTLSLSSTIYCQTIIMEENNGIYKIPCLVNGAKMKLIFDTGASSVSLSMAMAEYLLDNDYISEEDFIGTGKSSVADGSIVDHLIINLKDIEIGENLHLTNVRAVVIKTQNAPLLLGQSAIQQLGKITLNKNILTIGNGDHLKLTKDNWIKKAIDFKDSGLWRKAYNAFHQASLLGVLNEYELYLYAKCAVHLEERETALSIAKRINNYTYFVNKGINIYYFIGQIYIMNDMRNDALDYIQIAFDTYIPNESLLDKALFARDIAIIYAADKQYNKAYEYIEKSIKTICFYYNVELDFLFRDSKGELNRSEKSIRSVNKDIDEYIYWFTLIMHETGQITFRHYISILETLAKNNNRHAKKHLDDIEWDY